MKNISIRKPLPFIGFYDNKKGYSQHPRALKTSYIFVSYVLVTVSNPHLFTTSHNFKKPVNMRFCTIP